MPILEVSFTLRIPTDAYERVVASVAPAFADVPGLLWKIWLADAARGEAGGVYLFADDASLEAYLAGPLMAGLMRAEFQEGVRVRRFDVLGDASALTRAPLAHAPA